MCAATERGCAFTYPNERVHHSLKEDGGEEGSVTGITGAASNGEEFPLFEIDLNNDK